MTKQNDIVNDSKYVPLLDHGFVGLIDVMGSDSAIVQSARVSYGEGTKTVREDRGLIRYLMRHQHSSPFEMAQIKLHFKMPIFVARQLVRHRTACLAGQTELYFDLPNGIKYITIEKFYDMWTNGVSMIRNADQMKLRMCDEITGVINHTTITDIWQTGVKPVYKVSLENGYTIEMTKDHLCLTKNGWARLEDAIDLHITKDNSVSSWANCEFSVNGNEKNRTYSNIKKIEYVGEKMTYDLSVAGPYHNFVANGFVVHNSMNETSARYSLVPDEFYIPDNSVIMAQSSDNKQGRAGEIDEISKDGVKWLMNAAYETNHNIYRALLNERDDETESCYNPFDKEDPILTPEFPGIARELARSVLPVGMYTEFYWSQNLRNMLHLLKLRADSHAQYEIRVYANAMYDLLKPLFPLTLEAWEDYVRDATQVTRMEKNLIKELMVSNIKSMIEKSGSKKDFAESYGMSINEFNEFVKTWDIEID